MKRFTILIFGFLLLSALTPSSRAETADSLKEYAVAIHVHSGVSSGGWAISKIAQFAKAKQIDAVMMTDLLWEHYEYGLWPARNVVKQVIDRPSILKTGADDYLAQIRNANRETPEVLMMDGASAHPFYYWTGSPLSGKLTLNGRAKDFLVFGLPNAAAYDSLPVVGRPSSPYSPYEGDMGTEPYQRFINAVRNQGGLVFWSHPTADEDLSWEDALFKIKFGVDTLPYDQDLIGTVGYNGFGVPEVALAQMDTANGGLTAPGGLWDRLLQEYAGGRRALPAWVIGEVDYTGLMGSTTDLAGIVNRVLAPEKSRKAILDSIRKGRVYLTMSNRSRSRFIELSQFAVFAFPDADEADLGETLNLVGIPMIKLTMQYSNHSEGPVHVQIIRNGKIIERFQDGLPLTHSFMDQGAPPGRTSYYRVRAWADDGSRLLTNPIFADRQAPEK